MTVIIKEIPKRYYLYGETGTGKSLFTKILSERMRTGIYRKSCSGYWNNYKGEGIIVIDDLVKEDWEYIKFNLKKWLDYDTFISTPLRNKETREEIKSGIEIDPSKYTFIITSYKPLEEFLNEESLKEGEKSLNERDISKIKRLIEVHEMKNTNLEDIKKDIEEILK